MNFSSDWSSSHNGGVSLCRSTSLRTSKKGNEILTKQILIKYIPCFCMHCARIYIIIFMLMTFVMCVSFSLACFIDKKRQEIDCSSWRNSLLLQNERVLIVFICFLTTSMHVRLSLLFLFRASSSLDYIPAFDECRTNPFPDSSLTNFIFPLKKLFY